VRSSFSNFDKKFIYGNSYDFGDFDSCISTRVDAMNIVGKHCMIKFQSNDVIPVNPRKKLLKGHSQIISKRPLKYSQVQVSGILNGRTLIPVLEALFVYQMSVERKL